MSASRDALIDVLAQHQIAFGGCACGAEPTPRLVLVSEQDQWLAEHQADALAAAGISPFRVDHVDAT